MYRVIVLVLLLSYFWSSLKTGPAWPRKTWPGSFKNVTTTDTHEFIQLFLEVSIHTAGRVHVYRFVYTHGRPYAHGQSFALILYLFTDHAVCLNLLILSREWGLPLQIIVINLFVPTQHPLFTPGPDNR